MLLNNLVASNSSRGNNVSDCNSDHSTRIKLLNTENPEQYTPIATLDNRIGQSEKKNIDEAAFLQTQKGAISHLVPAYRNSANRDFRFTPHFPTPLYHLKLRSKIVYTSLPLVDQLNLFQVALELFNRKGVRKIKKDSDDDCQSDEMCHYFFQSVGKAKVSPKLCTECRDMQKNRFRYDYYYVDLVEISQERTVVCSDCMYQLLRKHISGTEADLRSQLKDFRQQQPHGVLVDPFLVSCGY